MDPRKVTLRHFLDVAYAVFVDEYRKFGMDLMQALDAMSIWARGDGKETTTAGGNTSDKLAQLNAMMR